MRPVMLKGHERSIVFVKYNREGDLLFSCSKDSVPTAWYADDGTRLGTFDGHRGTVWNCDVTDDSQFLISASADQSAKLWRVSDGTCLRTFNQTGPARWAAFSEGCREFLVARDNFKEHACAVCLYKLDLDAAASKWPTDDDHTEEPYITIHVHENPRQRITAALWMPLNTHLLVALENGTLKVFDTETGSCSREVNAHPDHNITSMAFSEDKTTFLTTSNDETAKLWDTKTLTVVKTYKCNTTVRSASLHPDRELILMGGGQEARDVTTSAAGAGKFETRIVHAVHCNELGKVQGHFGPLNTCAWNPSGTSFVTGGEDGYVRLHNMKEDWGVWEHFGEEPELNDPAVQQAVKDGLDLIEEEGEGAAGAAAADQ